MMMTHAFIKQPQRRIFEYFREHPLKTTRKTKTKTMTRTNILREHLQRAAFEICDEKT